jgi:hypothetical protein
VADVADVAVEGLDVVAVRVEQVRRVVARPVVAVPGLPVRAEARLDARAMEGVDLVFRARVEAEVQVLRRRPPVGDVEVREAGPVVAGRELRDPQRREHGFVEAHALGVVARVHVEVVEDPERPVPALDAHEAAPATPACHDAHSRA